jgi:hypothetical protein
MSSKIKSLRAEQSTDVRNAHDASSLTQTQKATPSGNGNHTCASSANSREINSPLLFSNNPQPMMIYNPETLLFLDVNAAALHQYGYTRDEILSMRLTDIRPA